MDAQDLFRQLGAGAKFDVRRFPGGRSRVPVNVENQELIKGSKIKKKGESLAERKREQNKKKRKSMTSGGTGRAGHKGKAVTFFTEDNKPLLRSIANVIQQAGCPVPEYIRGFQKLLSKQKKKMIKKPLQRESISTTPKYFLEQAKDKRKKVIGQNNKKKVALKDKS